ncbi:MAG: prepilin-type N-terminal cleavage/methylation domain-containing protein [Proteobacteria bacterium]|nr:prepilin-type N-terminal cleavage/methylation domain-containing protein [Desulfocapsa sp.]MBU3944028.1 prepilin-type N-terminal cleavage/methylation domain-containing protein [Pseudomonadota bacterium]MCG2745552.1 prepilin-type N-terminal cleavage/methylation domain-containing protein [Desulfobacteraceae bacterium]MBU3984859.1 prepilin-type N-terminal cleavage/methylation domain-containing protein [Pseudomonadota bacterium]MBU4029497.1 prepilin-type N-terminal cleavage/methylation domain-con
MKQLRNQKGFTLVEIAIVLVIIGLLLGGVLKGQELIENSKVKNAVNDLNGITAAYYGYVDRFKSIPGDDGPIATLNARGGTWATLVADGAGNNNGVLGPLLAAVTFTGQGTNDEGDAFWMQLKAAGLITGNVAAVNVAALPPNAFNGLTGVTTDGSIMVTAPATIWSGTKLCMSQVPGKSARAIDTQIDDGVGDTGSVRNTVGASGLNTSPGVAVAAYDDDNVYTICRSL